MERLEAVLETIKQLRKAKGLTQLEMSEKIGMAKNNYGKLENGHIELTVKRLFEISEILELDVSTLLGLDQGSSQESHLQEEVDRLKTENELMKEVMEPVVEIFSKAMGFLGGFTSKGNSVKTEIPENKEAVRKFKEAFEKTDWKLPKGEGDKQ